MGFNNRGGKERYSLSSWKIISQPKVNSKSSPMHNILKKDCTFLYNFNNEPTQLCDLTIQSLDISDGSGQMHFRKDFNLVGACIDASE